ncbi:multiubiquitin domain-containing protein [Acidicapsa dinghuensis]|uniref:Multiubiquitin domain-containing protein n=1 Tax=Acidicapsa dinghuensis TaxID=2218256 RepID=A0ABW1ECK9_9BACT|nr:multiubiquitin domain-containing protein [Acidicapsa dinghuensis]
MPEGIDQELEEFKRKQAKELEEFERQRHERLEKFEVREQEALRAFEKKEASEVHAFEVEAKREFVIKIDRQDYHVHQRSMTGSELRNLPKPPIGPDRDLFEVVPGGSDRKIEDTEVVKMRDGLRFFTAPARINPGARR